MSFDHTNWWLWLTFDILVEFGHRIACIGCRMVGKFLILSVLDVGR